jgi:hypothetical protein
LLPRICTVIQDHFIDASIVERMGGYPKAAAVIRGLLPTSKRIRSGDLGEILATEYVETITPFAVPLRKLRYKDDGNLAMRGNDVIGIQKVGRRYRVLKVEAKSRTVMAAGVVGEQLQA